MLFTRRGYSCSFPFFTPYFVYKFMLVLWVMVKSINVYTGIEYIQQKVLFDESGYLFATALCADKNLY